MPIQELAIKKAFNVLAQIPAVAAQKAYLFFLRDQVAILLYEKNRLTKEVKELREKNALLLKEKDELENKTKFIDIGPVFIKKSKSGIILDGFYCPKCRMAMNRDDYTTNTKIYKDIFYCETCKGSFFVRGEQVDQALDQYLKEDD